MCKFRLFKRFWQARESNKMLRKHLTLCWELWATLQLEFHSMCSPRMLWFSLQKDLHILKPPFSRPANSANKQKFSHLLW